jgi:hypothetical protein
MADARAERRKVLVKCSHLELMNSVLDLEDDLARLEKFNTARAAEQTAHYNLLEKMLDDFGVRAKGFQIGRNKAEEELEWTKQELQRALGYIDRINEEREAELPLQPVATYQPAPIPVQLGPKFKDIRPVSVSR